MPHFICFRGLVARINIMFKSKVLRPHCGTYHTLGRYVQGKKESEPTALLIAEFILSTIPRGTSYSDQYEADS